MKTDCIARPIGWAFAVYGRFVSRHPAWFIVVPLVVAAALVSGLQFMKLEVSNSLLTCALCTEFQIHSIKIT